MGETEVEKRCGYLAFATLLVEFLYHRFPVGKAENDRAKNWKDHVFPCLTPGDANETPSFWHSSIFVSFWRISPRRSNPARRDYPVTKGKRRDSPTTSVEQVALENMPSGCLDASHKNNSLLKKALIDDFDLLRMLHLCSVVNGQMQCDELIRSFSPA
jgi:hypothetical protein